jgi:hypothetical protein
VECAKFLNIIILCPIIYLDYFLCIKYQYMNKYMKIGKRKEISLLTRPRGGGILAQPGSARGRAAGGPAWPTSGGRRRGHRPTCHEEGEQH